MVQIKYYLCGGPEFSFSVLLGHLTLFTALAPRVSNTSNFCSELLSHEHIQNLQTYTKTGGSLSSRPVLST